MSNERAAAKLKVSHDTITLQHNSLSKLWQVPNSDNWCSLERAVLNSFKREGWNGYAREGGLILNLIKAASFKLIPIRQRLSVVEALYAKNVSFQEDVYESEFMLQNIIDSNIDQISNNFRIMVEKIEYGRRRPKSPEESVEFYYNSQSVLDMFPDLTETLFRELYSTLGAERLHSVARIFSIDPYEYRKGWPDLIIWKGDLLRFVEVKAPNDSIRPSQKKIILDILKPLDFDITILDVVKDQ